MSNEDLFYICGIGLAVSAVVISLIGLRSEKFPGRALPGVILWFAILVGGATTFAVLHAQDEEHAKAAEFEQAGEEIEREESDPSQGSGASQGAEQPSKPKAASGGPGGTLQLAADPTALAFDKPGLTSKPGQVTIEFTNPAAIEHDVAIEQGDKEIAVSDLIGKGKTSVSADLAAGTYTFICTVPGHAEAGMEGTLTVR
jgi:plastocyanin